jgi:hypothetical protein
MSDALLNSKVFRLVLLFDEILKKGFLVINLSLGCRAFRNIWFCRDPWQSDNTGFQVGSEIFKTISVAPYSF